MQRRGHCTFYAPAMKLHGDPETFCVFNFVHLSPRFKRFYETIHQNLFTVLNYLFQITPKRIE